MTEGPGVPRLLVVGQSPLLKCSFGITLGEVYRTGLLQRQFEVSQFVHTADPGRTGTDRVDGVELHHRAGPVEDALAEVMAVVAPEVVLLHGEIGHFPAQVRLLSAWPGRVVGWFPVNFERESNPLGWSAVLERCDTVAAVSRFGQDQLLRDRAQVDLVRLGVDTSRFHPLPEPAKTALRKTKGWDRDGFVFLYVGRNNPRKGPAFAVEAFRLVRRDRPDANTYLYLHTELDQGLAELIHASGLTGRVWLSKDYDAITHPLTGDEMAQLYQASDAFLLPSASEGFGMPLLEAQAAGLPVIATNTSAIPEVIEGAGLLIDAPARHPGLDSGCLAWARVPDLDHAAQLMSRIHDNPELRATLARHGLARAATWSWETTTKDLITTLATPCGHRVLHELSWP